MVFHTASWCACRWRVSDAALRGLLVLPAEVSADTGVSSPSPPEELRTRWWRASVSGCRWRC